MTTSTTTFCDHCDEEQTTSLMYHYSSLTFDTNNCIAGESVSLCETCFTMFGEPKND
jgi:hypothetical protein